MRRTLVFTLVFAMAAAIAAQQPPPQAPPAAGLIVGRVVDAQSSQPVAGVFVALNGGPPQTPNAPRVAPVRTITDAQGRFLFRGITSGSYLVTAGVGSNGYTPNGFIVTGNGFLIGGYLEGGYGQRRPNGPYALLDVKGSEAAGDVVIKLWKAAVVTGRVLDEAEEPLVNQVVGIVPFNTDGRLLNGPTMRTNDLGEYRFSGLAPGNYVVYVPQTQISVPVSVADELASGPPDPAAAQRFSQATAPSPSSGGIRVGGSLITTVPDATRFSASPISNALASPGEGDRVTVYRTTFHPSAVNVGQAARLKVSAGDELSGIDVHLQAVPGVAVSGTVVDSSGPVPGLGLHLMPAEQGEDAAILEVGMTVSDSRGAFAFPVVPAGRYMLIAWRAGGVPTGNQQKPFADPTRVAEQPGAWAIQPVVVGRGPVESVIVTIRPPVTVTGRVEFSGASERPAAERLQSGFLVTVWESRSLFRAPGPSSGSRIEPVTGRIVVRGVSPPGRYFIGSPALPAPWTVESITIGGRDATDAAFAIGDTDVNDVVITYTDRPASLAGTVALPKTAGDAGASVFLFPANRARWIDARLGSRTFRVTRTSPAGAFNWTSVPPGDYLLAALRDEDAGDWPDVQFLTRLASIATPIKVSANQAVKADLSLSVIK
jgi:protocatechuate 3,4-dioxygenase beta subunit